MTVVYTCGFTLGDDSHGWLKLRLARPLLGSQGLQHVCEHLKDKEVVIHHLFDSVMLVAAQNAYCAHVRQTKAPDLIRK